MIGSKPGVAKSLPHEKPFVILNILKGTLLVTLWIITIVLGILDIAAIRDGILTVYPKFTAANQAGPNGYNEIMTWLYGLTFILSVALTVFSIDSGKLHLKYYGQPKSWRFFAWTIGSELFVLVLNLVIHLMVSE